MIRESKMTLKQVGPNSVDIYCETRDDYGPWEKQGVIPVMGTVEEVRAKRIANQEKWGWTLYDIEEDNVLTFWKEF